MIVGNVGVLVVLVNYEFVLTTAEHAEVLIPLGTLVVSEVPVVLEPENQPERNEGGNPVEGHFPDVGDHVPLAGHDVPDGLPDQPDDAGSQHHPNVHEAGQEVDSPGTEGGCSVGLLLASEVDDQAPDLPADDDGQGADLNPHLPLDHGETVPSVKENGQKLEHELAQSGEQAQDNTPGSYYITILGQVLGPLLEEVPEWVALDLCSDKGHLIG